MPAYMIVQSTVTDAEAYTKYREAVVPLIVKFGGKGIRKGQPVDLEGGAGGIALFEFPSVETIQAFWNSDEYVAIKGLRDGAAELDVWAVPG